MGFKIHKAAKIRSQLMQGKVAKGQPSKKKSMVMVT
jgi:hypothetical protein